MDDKSQLQLFRVRISGDAPAGSATETSHKAASAEEAMHMALKDWAASAMAVVKKVEPTSSGLTAYVEPVPGVLFYQGRTNATLSIRLA